MVTDVAIATVTPLDHAAMMLVFLGRLSDGRLG